VRKYSVTIRQLSVLDAPVDWFVGGQLKSHTKKNSMLYDMLHKVLADSFEHSNELLSYTKGDFLSS
jgi:hypothetical protein